MKTTETNREMLINSKQYVNNGLTFPSPYDLLKPFIENDNLAGQLQFQGTHPITLAENGKEMTAYGRVSAIAELDIDQEIKYNVGLVYSLEQGKPVFKVFSGAKVTACTNLCVWGANKIAKIDNFTNLQSIYTSANEFLKTVQKDIEHTKEIIHLMKNFKISAKDTNQIVGKILLDVIKNKAICGTNTIVNAGKLLTDQKNKYYLGQENFNAWLLYNALTESYAEKTHILDQPEKVLNLFDIIKENTYNFSNVEIVNDIKQLQEEKF